MTLIDLKTLFKTYSLITQHHMAMTSPVMLIQSKLKTMTMVFNLQVDNHILEKSKLKL